MIKFRVKGWQNPADSQPYAFTANSYFLSGASLLGIEHFSGMTVTAS